MPLIFFVVLVIVIIVNIHDRAEFNAEHPGAGQNNFRKTNAHLEWERILSHKDKDGMSWEDAYRSAIQEMRTDGYSSPCIPFSAIDQSYSSISPRNPDRYNSSLVRSRLDEAMHFELIPKESSIQDYYDFIFSNKWVSWPKNQFEADMDFRRLSKMWRLKKVGTYIIHPRYGTCKILRWYMRDKFNVRGDYICEAENGSKVSISFDNINISSL